MYIRTNRQSGFTLVELAIALVVIGLLIGGILKGRELVDNAKVTKTIRELREYEAAVASFQGAYETLPGDMMDPGDRLPDCADGTCDYGGDGNGKIMYPTGGFANIMEEQNFLIHMGKAGYLSANQYGSWMLALGGARMHYRMMGSYLIGYEGHMLQNLTVRPQLARRLDTKMDDGAPRTGRVQAMSFKRTPGTTLLTFPTAGENVCMDATATRYVDSENESYVCSVGVLMNF